MDTCFSGFSCWCITSPNPALQSEKAGTNTGTSWRKASSTSESFFLACLVSHRPISRMNSRDE